jgi:hypothetical protein
MVSKLSLILSFAATRRFNSPNLGDFQQLIFSYGKNPELRSITFTGKLRECVFETDSPYTITGFIMFYCIYPET